MRRSYYRTYAAEERYERLKAGIKIAFAALRKQNIIAKQNFMCCNGCAGNFLATWAFERFQKGKKINGLVMFTQQGEANLREYGNTFLSYGTITHSAKDTPDVVMGLPTIEVGSMVCKALAEANVPYEWDGNPETTIRIGEWKSNEV